jgi:hypothetical protein
LKPWPKGVSGNPGGRPKSKPITEEIESLLEQPAPGRKGQTWAEVIADAMIRRAAKGDVRAFVELANRLEGKPVQAVNVNRDALEGLAEELAAARKRAEEPMSDEEIREQISQLEQRLGSKSE